MNICIMLWLLKEKFKREGASDLLMLPLWAISAWSQLQWHKPFMSTLSSSTSFVFFYLSFLWFGLCQIGSLSTTPWGMLWRFSVWKRLSSWVVGSRPDAVPQSWTRARLKWVWMSLNSGSPHQPQQNGTVAEPCCFWHTASTSVALCSQNLKFHWEPLVLLEYSWRLTLASWNYDQQREAVSTTGHFYMPALNWCLPATEAMMLPGGAAAGQSILPDFL